MATWSDWFRAAEQYSLPLKDVLKINTEQDIRRLEESGLPHFDSMIIKGTGFDREQIKQFAKKYPNTWMRVVNRKTKERKYKIGMKGFDEIMEFIDSLNVIIADHDFQLFENCETMFGGNVITAHGKTVIEIIEGSQDMVGKSKAPFFHGRVTDLGKLDFMEGDVPDGMKRAAAKVLSHLKLSRNSCLPGYFEFLVSDTGKVYFLDYKTGFS